MLFQFAKKKNAAKVREGQRKKMHSCSALVAGEETEKHERKMEIRKQKTEKNKDTLGKKKGKSRKSTERGDGRKRKIRANMGKKNMSLTGKRGRKGNAENRKTILRYNQWRPKTKININYSILLMSETNFHIWNGNIIIITPMGRGCGTVRTFAG